MYSRGLIQRDDATRPQADLRAFPPALEPPADIWKPTNDPALAPGAPPPPATWPNQGPAANALGPGRPPGGAGCALFWDLTGCRPGGPDAGTCVQRNVASLYGDVRSARAYGDVAALPGATRAGLQAAGVHLIDTSPAGMTDRSPLIVDLFDYALAHAVHQKDGKSPILVCALGGSPREQFGLAFARLAERGYKVALIRPRDSPCARYDRGCIGVHDWGSVRPGDDNDTVAMCFKCGWRNCRRAHPRRCSALVCCALCGQSSHDTRYHAEFQQYVSRRATETAQRQVDAAAAQGLPIPSYAAPRLHALPPPAPAHFPGQAPYVGQTTPGLAALQNALRYAPPRAPPMAPNSPPRTFTRMMGALDLTAQPWQPGRQPLVGMPQQPSSPPALLQPQAFALADTAAAPERPTAVPPAPASVPPKAEAPPGLAPAPTAPESEDPVDLSRLHYGVEDYVKMGVPEEDARAILRAVNKLAKDRDDAAVASGAAADLDAEA